VPWHHHPSHQAGVVAPPVNKLGLSIEEKDLFFFTRVGRWPLPCPRTYAIGLSMEEKDLRLMAHQQSIAASPPPRP